MNCLYNNFDKLNNYRICENDFYYENNDDLLNRLDSNDKITSYISKNKYINLLINKLIEENNSDHYSFDNEKEIIEKLNHNITKSYFNSTNDIINIINKQEEEINNKNKTIEILNNILNKVINSNNNIDKNKINLIIENLNIYNNIYNKFNNNKKLIYAKIDIELLDYIFYYVPFDEDEKSEFIIELILNKRENLKNKYLKKYNNIIYCLEKYKYDIINININMNMKKLKQINNILILTLNKINKYNEDNKYYEIIKKNDKYITSCGEELENVYELYYNVKNQFEDYFNINNNKDNDEDNDDNEDNDD